MSGWLRNKDNEIKYNYWKSVEDFVFKRDAIKTNKKGSEETLDII